MMLSILSWVCVAFCLLSLLTRMVSLLPVLDQAFNDLGPHFPWGPSG